MKNYHQMLKDVLENGHDQLNQRTGQICRCKVGYQLEYSLSDGFPAITTKKLAFNGVKGELLGFFRGYTNAADFRALGCQVWNDNANTTPAWLANPYRGDKLDALGPIYGAQWTAWKAYREQELSDHALVEHLTKNGFNLVATNGPIGVFRKTVNQLENALRTILTNPSDRRIIVSGWNVGELDMMALPPCHMDYRFTVLESPAGGPSTLHVTMTIRSWDLFLGGPFNISSTSLFLAIMAKLAGLKAGNVVIQATNAHIYETHFDQVREQLGRAHLAPPTLVLSDQIAKVESLEAIQGAFSRIEPDDIQLEGYQSHAAIRAPMAA